MEKKLEGVQLSYSSAVLLSNCEQRYYNYKVAKCNPDKDYVDNTHALTIGSAFHSVLEGTLHTTERLQEIMTAVFSMYELEEEDRALVESMVFKYLKLHKKSELEVVAVEFELSKPTFLGYVDALMKQTDGTWWIVDLKTCARLSTTLLPRLKNDFQLNLYCHFSEEIAERFGLDPEKFGGARYRSTTKPKLVRKQDEPYNSYVRRLAKSCKSYDIVVKKEYLDTKSAWERHFQLHSKAVSFHHGVKPSKNYSYCDSYFKACPYWSQCHGHIFSESAAGIEVVEEK